MQEAITMLRQFAFSEAFKISFLENSIAFTGKFIDNSKGTVIGKQLYIPLSPKHQALTLTIVAAPFSKLEVDSLIVSFDSVEERELVSIIDFSNEIFFIEK